MKQVLSQGKILKRPAFNSLKRYTNIFSSIPVFSNKIKAKSLTVSLKIKNRLKRIKKVAVADQLALEYFFILYNFYLIF